MRVWVLFSYIDFNPYFLFFPKVKVSQCSYFSNIRKEKTKKENNRKKMLFFCENGAGRPWYL